MQIKARRRLLVLARRRPAISRICKSPSRPEKTYRRSNEDELKLNNNSQRELTSLFCYADDGVRVL